MRQKRQLFEKAAHYQKLKKLMKLNLVLQILLASLAVRADAVEVPVFIVAGQSNAVGYGLTPTHCPPP